jgi:hypothetical protein
MLLFPFDNLGPGMIRTFSCEFSFRDPGGKVILHWLVGLKQFPTDGTAGKDGVIALRFEQ